jgi:hypothetical protein
MYIRRRPYELATPRRPRRACTRVRALAMIQEVPFKKNTLEAGVVAYFLKSARAQAD